jgi:predicted PurR-regulated permease PerM
MVLVLFFFYRDGRSVWLQIRKVALHFGVVDLDLYADAVGMMARSIFLGIVVAAVMQGVVAGIGYRIVGVGAPVVLGALTALLSVVPLFGTTLVWGPLVIWFLINGQFWQAAIMVAWGVLLVHPIDNVLRTILISGTARMPLLLVLFGVLGGLIAFGLIGIFVGPIILAVARVAWQRWVSPVSREGST